MKFYLLKCKLSNKSFDVTIKELEVHKETSKTIKIWEPYKTINKQKDLNVIKTNFLNVVSKETAFLSFYMYTTDENIDYQINRLVSHTRRYADKLMENSTAMWELSVKEPEILKKPLKPEEDDATS